jgi:hypothetical protein
MKLKEALDLTDIEQLNKEIDDRREKQLIRIS